MARSSRAGVTGLLIALVLACTAEAAPRRARGNVCSNGFFELTLPRGMECIPEGGSFVRMLDGGRPGRGHYLANRAVGKRETYLMTSRGEPGKTVELMRKAACKPADDEKRCMRRELGPARKQRLTSGKQAHFFPMRDKNGRVAEFHGFVVLDGDLFFFHITSDLVKSWNAEAVRNRFFSFLSTVKRVKGEAWQLLLSGKAGKDPPKTKEEKKKPAKAAHSSNRLPYRISRLKGWKKCEGEDGKDCIEGPRGQTITFKDEERKRDPKDVRDELRAGGAVARRRAKSGVRALYTQGRDGVLRTADGYILCRGHSYRFEARYRRTAILNRVVDTFRCGTGKKRPKKKPGLAKD